MNEKTPFERLHEAIKTRDIDVIDQTIDEVTTSDVVFHTPVPAPANTPGIQLLKQVWVVLLRAFPDIRVSIEDVITEGDKSAYRQKVTGTHLGEYRGFPPTGKSISYDEIFIVRYAGGRVAEVWGVVDVYSQLRQIGLIPALPLEVAK